MSEMSRSEVSCTVSEVHGVGLLDYRRGYCYSHLVIAGIAKHMLCQCRDPSPLISFKEGLQLQQKTYDKTKNYCSLQQNANEGCNSCASLA